MVSKPPIHVPNHHRDDVVVRNDLWIDSAAALSGASQTRHDLSFLRRLYVDKVLQDPQGNVSDIRGSSGRPVAAVLNVIYAVSQQTIYLVVGIWLSG